MVAQRDRVKKHVPKNIFIVKTKDNWRVYTSEGNAIRRVATLAAEGIKAYIIRYDKKMTYGSLEE